MVIKTVQRNIRFRFLLLSYLLVAIISFSSCTKKCEIKPIDETVDIVSDTINPIQLRNKDGNSIILNLSFYENLMIDKEHTSFSNYRECGHIMYREYNLNSNTISFKLTKKSEDRFVFDVITPCDSQEFTFDKINPELYLQVDINVCDKGDITSMTFVGFSLKEIQMNTKIYKR